MSLELKVDLVTLSEKAYGRLRQRLEGLGDDEYLWEPAPVSWSVREAPDGEVTWDFGLAPSDPAPVTTIAWRMIHIVDLLTEERCGELLGIEPRPQRLRITARAGEAIADLEHAFEVWRGYLEDADEARLGEQLEGYWRDRLTFAFHIIDELIHHAAEIGLLRDLYRAAAQSDEVRDAALRGDRAAVDRFGASAVAALRDRRPQLLVDAAAAGLWEAVDLLVDLDFDVNPSSGASALHHAAGLGRIDLVRKLLEHGARTDAIDDTFKATPLQWAESMSRRLGGPNASGADWPAVIGALSSRATGE